MYTESSDDTSDHDSALWTPQTESGLKLPLDLPEDVGEAEHVSFSLEHGEELQGHKTSNITRISYGCGGILAYAPNLIVAFFLNPFLLEVAQLDSFLAGWILLIGNVVDAFTDPLIGFLSDATPWGPKRLPWIGFGILPFCVFYFWLWLTPPFLQAQWAKMVYYTSMYIGRTFCLTCIIVPYNSLSAEITPSYDERSRLVGVRWLVSLAGGSICVVLQSLLVEAFSLPDGETDYSKGYAVAGAVEVAIFIGSAVALLAFVREPERARDRPKSQFGVIQGVIECLKNVPFVLITINFAMSYIALSLVSTNFFLYIKYVVKLEEYYTLILFLVIGCASLSVPCWGMVSIKIGKTRTFYAGGSAFVFFIGLLSFLPENASVVLMFILAIGAGLALGTLYLIPYSLIPDVVEVDELKTGERREGAYFSLYVFFEKFCLAFAYAITNWILGLSGYESPGDQTLQQQEDDYQPDSTIIVLRIMTGVFPAFLVVIAILVLLCYPISKEKHTEILEQLSHQRREKAAFQKSKKRQSIGYNAISPGRERRAPLTADSDSEDLDSPRSEVVKFH